MVADCSLFLLSVNTIPTQIFCLLIFLVCECILHLLIHARGHRRSLTARQWRVRTPGAFTRPGHPEHAHIPLVCRDNLLRSSQIAVAFAAPAVIPPVAHRPGKVGYFWGSRRGALGLCPQRGCTLSYPHRRRIWVTKIAFFGGSTLTSSGGMENFSGSRSLLRSPAHRCTSLRAPARLSPGVILQGIKCSAPWLGTLLPFFSYDCHSGYALSAVVSATLWWRGLRSLSPRTKWSSPQPAFSFPAPPLVMMICGSKAQGIGLVHGQCQGTDVTQCKGLLPPYLTVYTSATGFLPAHGWLKFVLLPCWGWEELPGWLFQLLHTGATQSLGERPVEEPLQTNFHVPASQLWIFKDLPTLWNQQPYPCSLMGLD